LNQAERIKRAICSLEGLSVGDAFGDRFFFMRFDGLSFQPIEDRTPPPRPWDYSDDTQMALSIFSILRQHGQINQDALARNFAEHFMSARGYGPAMYDLLPRLRDGASWKSTARSLFGGQGSYGNGGAMRVAPLGAYFADDIQAAAEQARLSCEITHAHPEAVAGAIAVAVAAALAWQLKTAGKRPTRQAFLGQIHPLIPASKVREKTENAQHLPEDVTVREAVIALGNGSGISAQDTVPFALWCAGEQLDNYEEAIWLTLSGGGDYDTNSAIVGGIVAAHTGIEGIPAAWRTYREPLPDWAFNE
jgi:ADP-ribosylglycohydrolase